MLHYVMPWRVLHIDPLLVNPTMEWHVKQVCQTEMPWGGIFTLCVLFKHAMIRQRWEVWHIMRNCKEISC